MIVAGAGPPVVLVPGIQGRWEWIRPAIDALARQTRVVSYSLCGEPGSRRPIDAACGFDSFLLQLDEVLDAAGMPAAVICGVSYGGLIALRYAARRPERVLGLVLVSTPGPSWTPDRHVRQYLRAPYLTAPLFLVRSPGRLLPEIWAAFPDLAARVRFTARHLARVLAAPIRPRLMAERIRLLASLDVAGECRLVRAPSLIVTGEPSLDRVISVEDSREYLRLLPGARGVTLERTGHIGLLARVETFAGLIASFARDAASRGRTT